MRIHSFIGVAERSSCGARAEPAIEERATERVYRAVLGGIRGRAHSFRNAGTLLAIIALAEIILGTVTSGSALIAESSWSAETILLLCSGIALAFGMTSSLMVVVLGWESIGHRAGERALTRAYG